MKLLVIDTSSSACSVAVTADGRLLAELVLNLERTLSARLLRSLESILNLTGLSVADIDGIGVSIGPGSFTGLRVGIATAKGLALATGKPVVGFSSLAMLAMNLPMAAYQVCPMFDARKGEVYTALYRCFDLPEVIASDCVVSPAAFLKDISEPTIFVGEGALRYRALIMELLGERALFPPPALHSPRASAGALLARHLISQGEAVPPSRLHPIYIRPSEAEVAKMKRETLI